MLSASSSFTKSEPYGITVASQPSESPQRSPRELFRAYTVPAATAQPSVKPAYRRPHQSHGSVGSQDYTRSLEQRPFSHIKETLMPLFRLEHGISRDDLFLKCMIERLFNRLDILKRGLYRAQFETKFL